ncbi:MAG: protein kinase [Myxococcota bacterium]|nr:protein kinase [Myxococcota bacterium]
MAALVGWYNGWRPHETLGGATPNEIYRRRKPAPGRFVSSKRCAVVPFDSVDTTLPATVRCLECGWANAAAAASCRRCESELPRFEPMSAARGLAGDHEGPRLPPGIYPGAVIGGRYRLGPKIGCGGAAVVFEALDLEARRGVAAKVLLAGLGRISEAVRRFRREAEIQVRLRHPAILTVLDFVGEGRTLAIISELARGPSLAQRLAEEGPLRIDSAVRLFHELLGALAAAHAHDVVHRDIKPANVLFDRLGAGACAKVTDFGLAKVLGSGEKLTTTGTQMGTHWYMAPEQCRSARRADARSDIYSLGVTMFHALTGRVPFDGKHPSDVVNAHLRLPPPHPRSIRPAIPPLLADVILQCLAKAVDDRFQSAGAVREALRAIARTACPPTPRCVG